MTTFELIPWTGKQIKSPHAVNCSCQLGIETAWLRSRPNNEAPPAWISFNRQLRRMSRPIFNVQEEVMPLLNAVLRVS
jgi:hypothetical protein